MAVTEGCDRVARTEKMYYFEASNNLMLSVCCYSASHNVVSIQRMNIYRYGFYTLTCSYALFDAEQSDFSE